MTPHLSSSSLVRAGEVHARTAWRGSRRPDPCVTSAIVTSSFGFREFCLIRKSASTRYVRLARPRRARFARAAAGTAKFCWAAVVSRTKFCGAARKVARKVARSSSLPGSVGEGLDALGVEGLALEVAALDDELLLGLGDLARRSWPAPRDPRTSRRSRSARPAACRCASIVRALDGACRAACS